jgi:hypothetical protein
MSEITNTDLAVSIARLEGKVDNIALIAPVVKEIDKRVDSLESSRSRLLGAFGLLTLLSSLFAWFYDKLPFKL